MKLNSYTETEYADLISKLKDYCKCIPAGTTDETIWKGGLFQIMILFSNFLRWNDGKCNDMLSRTRRYKKETTFDCCMNGIELPHNEITEITSFNIFKVTECEEIQYKVLTPIFSCLTDKVRLCKDTELLSECLECTKFGDVWNCCKCRCRCEPKWYVDIEYLAGYEEIPECLIPLICELYSYIQLMNNKCLDQCATSENVSYNAVLKSLNVGDRNWEWNVPNNLVEDAFASFVSKGLFSVLSNYSNKIPKVFSIDIIC